MVVLKCTICGGELEVNSDLTVGVCKYCESTIVIPKNVDRKGNLYNRAVFLRQNNEFDKASDAYEELLREDNTDAEAHWGLVLSKYGIEYIDDPKTGKKIPTCHRTQSNSILNDIDYLAALQYSDSEAKNVIETEANRISEIQKRILELSQKEEPYDIFICYKESDEQGNRTQDSTLAQEVYYELTKKGYKVFFARKTLESKLGTEYEPIIYAALNSAKVMVVIGTLPEYFNAVWVKNEWSRFLEMGQSSNKVIIPAYRGMSPYELPVELSSLQSLDMSKLGFIQDLTDGIDKILRNNSNEDKLNPQKPGANATGSYSVDELERYIQNGETYIRLKNFSDADEVYTTISKKYPEDYRGWWGKIISITQDFNYIDLSILSQLNTIFEYVRQLTPKDRFVELENQYIEYTRKTAEVACDKEINQVKEIIYNVNQGIIKLETDINEQKSKVNNNYNLVTERKNVLNVFIQQAQARINMLNNEQNSTILSVIAALTFLITTIILLKTGHPIWMLLTGFLTFVTGTSALGGIAVYGKHQTEMADLQTQIKESYQSIEDNEKGHNKFVEYCQQQIKQINEIIQVRNEYIVSCKDYISLEKKYIIDELFSIQCSAFGVEIEKNEEISNKRKLVFDSIKDS